MNSNAHPGHVRGRARENGDAAAPASADAIPCGARRSPLSVALTLALSLATGPAAAAGLGRIELASGLNERLDARIPLYNASDYPPGSIEVGLASLERFRAADMERPHALTGLRFELEPAPSGNGHMIRVRSPDAIREPFLRFLVAVDLPDGRLVRAYTVLLDPPSFAPEATPVAQSAPAGADTEGKADHAAAPASGSVAAATSDGPGRYGPVPRGSSAWRVAARVQPPGVSIYQTMVALRRANPGAFRDGDLGQLRQGVWLEVPSAAQIAAIPQARAVGIYRQYLAQDDEPAAGAEPSAQAAAPAEAAAADTRADAADERATGTAAPAATAATATTAAATGEGTASGDGSVSGAPATPAGAARASMAAAATTGVAADTPARGPRLARVRTDIAGLETRIAGLRQRVDGGLTAQAEGIEQLRAALAGVRGELATLRETRAQVAAPASGGLSLWSTGLIALLAAGLGAVGGFLRGRRSAGPGGAAAATVSRPADEVPGRAPSPVATAPAVGGEEPPAEARGHARAGTDDTDADAVAETGTAAEAEIVPEYVPGPDPGQTPGGEPAAETAADGANWIDPEGVTAGDPDSYQSLADLCLEAGWARDAEGVLRDAIEQRGDDPGYRAGILAALHHEGVADEFRQEFEHYRAVAADEDPSWAVVLRMGRELCPGDPAFAAAADTGTAPAAGEPADEVLELDDFEAGFEDALDPGELDDLDALEALDPAAGLDYAAAGDGPESPDGEAGPAGEPPDPEASDEPEFELSLDAAEPAAAQADDPAGPDAEWPELDLDDVVPAEDAVESGATTDEDPDAVAATPAGDVTGDDKDPAVPLPTLDPDPDAGTETGSDTGADGDDDSTATATGSPDPAVAPAEVDEDGDFKLSLARVYLKAGWARDAEAVLREGIAQHGREPAYRARLLEALYQAEARNEFLEAFDAYRAIAPDDDPDWDEIRRMGRSLWPTHEAFAEPEPGTAADQPAPDRAAGAPEAAPDEGPDEAVEASRRRRRA